MPMMLFDAIGRAHNKTRVADDRIVSELIRLSDLEKGDCIVADIGAGTGNYSIALANAGFQIRAIEPSAAMLSRLERKGNIERIVGCAENVPLKTGSVGAVISVLALPHFSDIKQAFIEMARVIEKGPIVLFTFDPMIGKKTWIYDYFPFCWDKFGDLPTAESMAKMLHHCTNLSPQIVPFKLPPDLKDHFAAAAWKNPPLYLDADYRLNISSFRLADSAAVDNGVKRLAADLKNGCWKKSYGEVLKMSEFDAGYYFLLAK
jgi:ubiquinone/menaquinone biosynthesis C-methylase UbiE